MDDKTLTALQGSIKKWEAIANGTGFDDGPRNCPLCIEFADVYEENSIDEWRREGCCGCPVAEHVEDSGCGQTPYMNWIDYLYDSQGSESIEGTNFGYRYRVFDERSKRLAQAELDFLRSLLPSSTR